MRACGVWGASLDAPGGAAALQPPARAWRTPARLLADSLSSPQSLSTLGSVCPQTDSLVSCAQGYVRVDQPQASGPRRQHSRVAAQAGPGDCPPSSPQARMHPRAAAAARKPATRPRIYIFPSLRAEGSPLHLNEELRASRPSEAGARGVTRERRPQN